jgi:Fumarylacetoacetate (FAA) hydrolase family
MFHPVDHPLERGWVGRIEGDRVIHLAAQTLQSFFTGGGGAREHAVYALDDVCLLAPVLHPPAVRVFADQHSFAFANPAAIAGPRMEVGNGAATLGLHARLAGVIGADGTVGGVTILADWRDPGRSPPKDRDFALGLGPFLVTWEALEPDGLEAVVQVEGVERLRGRFTGFDWAGARELAAAGTTLRPGDLLAGPALGPVEDIAAGSSVEVDVGGIGVLVQSVSA